MHLVNMLSILDINQKLTMKLLNSLNDHQRAYVDLELGDKATNGDYMLASYHLVPNGKKNILQDALQS